VALVASVALVSSPSTVAGSGCICRESRCPPTTRGGSSNTNNTP
jgi:hypothetical protein